MAARPVPHHMNAFVIEQPPAAEIIIKVKAKAMKVVKVKAMKIVKTVIKAKAMKVVKAKAMKVIAAKAVKATKAVIKAKAMKVVKAMKVFDAKAMKVVKAKAKAMNTLDAKAMKVVKVVVKAKASKIIERALHLIKGKDINMFAVNALVKRVETMIKNYKDLDRIRHNVVRTKKLKDYLQAGFDISEEQIIAAAVEYCSDHGLVQETAQEALDADMATSFVFVLVIGELKLAACMICFHSLVLLRISVFKLLQLMMHFVVSNG
jgi:hypothetical protein